MKLYRLDKIKDVFAAVFRFRKNYLRVGTLEGNRGKYKLKIVSDTCEDSKELLHTFENIFNLHS
jgi:hypothetical protein